MVDNETTTEKISKHTDLDFETRMKVAEKMRRKAEESGKSRKEIEWEALKTNAYERNDIVMAKQHLRNYIGECLKEKRDIDSICYDLFLDLTQGRNGLKRNAELIEFVIERVSNTKNIELLQSFVSYYEELGNTLKAEALYYTLYEIYANGIGIAPNNDKAIQYLKASIKGNNTEERRALLRALYEKDNDGETANKRSCLAYEKVIEDDIPGGKKDYAVYLMEQGRAKDAVGYFVADEDYESAYSAVNIKSKKDVDDAVKIFENADEVKGIKKSLKLMQTKHADLNTIFTCTMPASGFGMLWRYLLIGWGYVPYHTFKLSPIAFLLAVVLLLAVPCVLIFVMGQPQEVAAVAAFVCIAVWFISLVCVDVWRKYRFSQAKELWNKLIPHPQLESRRELFDDEVISQNNATLRKKIILGTVVALFGIVGALYGINKLMGDEILGSKVKEERVDKSVNSDADKSVDDIVGEKKNKADEKGIVKIGYKNFKDKVYGFYFEYPDTMEDVKQENTKNGTKEVRYEIKLSDNALVSIAMEFSSGYKGKIGENNIKDICEFYMKDEKKWRTEKGCNVEINKLDDKSFIIKWDLADNRAKKMIAKRCFLVNGNSVQDHYICLSYGPNDLDEKDEKIWEHMLNTFKPGQVKPK